MDNEKVMQSAIDRAENTMSQDIGGPFGAAVVKNGEVIVVTSNSVLRDYDPTAHAEVNAIREACKKLQTYDLSDCVMYATGYPCPMCLSAIMWANIKTVYYCNTVEEAEDIGFRDKFIYEYLETGNSDALKIERVELPAGKKLYDKYANMHKVIY